MGRKLEWEVDVEGAVDMMDRGEERQPRTVGDESTRRRILRPVPSCCCVAACPSHWLSDPSMVGIPIGMPPLYM